MTYIDSFKRTHDIKMLLAIFEELKNGKKTKYPLLEELWPKG